MTRFEAINEQIDEIMDIFDFNRVLKVMEMLEWTWSPSNCVPDEYEVRKSARRMMKQLIDYTDGGTTSSGGFRATLTQKADNEGKWLRVDLAFCIDDTLLDGEYYA
jgi:hypothetical protein